MISDITNFGTPLSGRLVWNGTDTDAAECESVSDAGSFSQTTPESEE
jgi:hypothetical protein